MILLIDYLKQTYGKRLIKLPVDAGFTCPNRDGTLSTAGCSFCSLRGSGEFTMPHLSLAEQLRFQKTILHKKWNAPSSYAAYFQNFTATYGSLPELKRRYDEVMQSGEVDGIIVATRPDCISEEIVRLLKQYPVYWVELGLQSTDNAVLKQENILYTYEDHLRAIRMLRSHGILCVTHLIVGLPNDDFLSGLKKLVEEEPIWGIKISMLNILKQTALAERWERSPWHLPSMEEYISLIREAFRILPEDTVVHRFTGDGKKEDMIAPLWIRNKRAILGGVMKKEGKQ